jgi:thermitase
MMTWFIGLLTMIGVLVGGYVWYERREDRKWDPHMPNQLVVKFKEDVTEGQKANIHKAADCRCIDVNASLGLHTIESKRKMRRMLAHYNALSEVDFAEPNYRFQAFETQASDPFFPYQYGPQRIGAPVAWNVSVSAPRVKIAVVDTGVQLNHPDLASKLVPGYDFISGDTTPNDGNGHGTHVAGIAASSTGNGTGIAGVAPLASILPVRVLDNSGGGSLSAVANGIVFAANQGAQVINLSLGSPAAAYSLQAAVRYAWQRGAVIVAAAGNDGSAQPNYPANYPNVIAVASTNEQDVRSPFSNYGTWVEVAAPGEDILSTYPRSWYTYLSGTSMAAPHVAGVAALLVAQGRTNEETRDVILQSADPIPGTGRYWVYGRVNATRAVRTSFD